MCEFAWSLAVTAVAHCEGWQREAWKVPFVADIDDWVYYALVGLKLRRPALRVLDHRRAPASQPCSSLCLDNSKPACFS